MHNTLPERPHWWQWPTILSLDAPAVLLAWQAVVAGAAGVDLRWTERFILAASVWLAYTGDRWLEAYRLDPTVTRTPRHRFHQRRRWPIAGAIAAVLAADVAVAVGTLAAPPLLTGLALTAAVLAYLLSHQWLHRHARWRVPKEVCVALLLAAGVWMFVRPAAHLVAWQPLGLFGLLVLTNTALISRWETTVDRLQGQTSLALESPHVAKLLAWLPWVTVVVAGFVIASGPEANRPSAAATLVSAILLATIDRFEPKLGSPLARVMSDLALMTPVLVHLAG